MEKDKKEKTEKRKTNRMETAAARIEICRGGLV
jgi:hypothetical protein